MTLVDTRATAGAEADSDTRRRGRGRGATTGAARASRSKSAQRALDRRSRRELSGSTLPVSGRRIAGMPLVAPVLVLVLGALALTLFLTTKSAQDSYAIDALRKQNQELQASADALKQQVDAGDSAPALAKAAARQGMGPATDSAEIIVGPDGKARLRGTPTPATGNPLPDLNPEPDPVDKIDKNKVDDSVGLGGTQDADEPSTSQVPTSQTPESQTPESQPPTSQTPESQAPAPNPRPTADRRPTANPVPDARTRVGQSTNVAPPSAATPRPNTVPPR